MHLTPDSNILSLSPNVESKMIHIPPSPLSLLVHILLSNISGWLNLIKDAVHLTSVVKRTEPLSNEKNRELIHKFVNLMKSTDTSEKNGMTTFKNQIIHALAP